MPRRSTTKTRHNPEDITTIRGYPDALKLFRMPASRYWYVRMYVRGRGLVKKSTQCEKLADAKHFAITWYEDLLLEKRGYQAIGAESFSVFASNSKTHKHDRSNEVNYRRICLMPTHSD